MNSQDFDKIDPDVNHFNQVSDLSSCTYCDFDKFPSESIKMNGGFSVMNFNIRSFFKNCDEFMSILKNPDLNIDVITLSETWLHDDTYQLCTIPGYQGFHSYRQNKEGGGVSVFVKETLIVIL